MAQHLVHTTLRITPQMKKRIHVQALRDGHGRDSIVTRMILTRYFMKNGARA
jgi:hypothetical protein